MPTAMRQLDEAVCLAINHKYPSNLDEYIKKWEMECNGRTHRPDMLPTLQKYIHAPIVYTDENTKGYYLQNHPDPRHDIRVVCINCLGEKKMGSFATHCPDCVDELPAYSDAQLEANKKKEKAPWLAAYLEQPAIKEEIQRFKYFGVGRRGSSLFYFLDPKKVKLYSVICTACGWSGSRSRFGAHAAEHQHKIEVAAEEDEFNTVLKTWMTVDPVPMDGKPRDRSPKKSKKKKKDKRKRASAAAEGGSKKKKKKAKRKEATAEAKGADAPVKEAAKAPEASPIKHRRGFKEVDSNNIIEGRTRRTRR